MFLWRGLKPGTLAALARALMKHRATANAAAAESAPQDGAPPKSPREVNENGTR